MDRHIRVMMSHLAVDRVSAAVKAGADAAEAIDAEHQALSVNVRLGALEEVEREEARATPEVHRKSKTSVVLR